MLEEETEVDEFSGQLLALFIGQWCRAMARETSAPFNGAVILSDPSQEGEDSLSVQPIGAWSGYEELVLSQSRAINRPLSAASYREQSQACHRSPRAYVSGSFP